MSALFISHSGKDKRISATIAERLRAQGHTSLFLDFDPADGIPPGCNWEHELYRRLRACRAVIVLCSEHSMTSEWCFVEITHARSMGKPVFPILIGPCRLRSILSEVQVIDMTGDPEAAYDRLWHGLKVVGLDASGQWDESRSPYPGLSAFDEKDAPVFFGRERDVQDGLELLNRLRQFGGPRFVLLLGASGSGKSSLLKAGLLPLIRRSPEHWIVVGPFRPLRAPMDEFISCLRRASEECDSDVSAELQTLSNGIEGASHEVDASLTRITSALRTAAGRPDATVVIVVDQFEELLGGAEAGQAKRLLALLRPALDDPEGRLMVLSSMRSDFLGALQTHPQLDAVRFEPVPLRTMSGEDFAHVIEGPAQLAGIELERGLAQAMVTDTHTGDALPLLAFTLRELWERHGAAGRFGLDGYRNELGGLHGCIRQVAESVARAQTLSSGELSALRRAFLHLVRLSDDGRYVRRPAPWSEIAEEARPVMTRFIDARLLTSRQDGSDRMVEVAHEALFRVWPQLRSWLEEGRDMLRLRDGIRRAAKEWGDGERTSDLLVHRGSRLEEAVDLLNRDLLDLDEQARAYVDACQDVVRLESRAKEEQRRRELQQARALAEEQRARALEQEQLVHEQQARAEEQKAAATRQRRYSYLLSIVAVVAVAAAGFGAWKARQATDSELQARRAEGEAIRERDRATQKEKEATVAARVAQEQRLRADDARREAERAEVEANAQRQIALARSLAAESRLVPSDGRDARATSTLLVAESLRRAHTLEASMAWAALVPAALRASEWTGHDGPVADLAFTGKAPLMATAGWDGTVRVRDWNTGHERVRLRHDGRVLGVDFSPDGRTVLTGSEDGTARSWDVRTGEERKRVTPDGWVVGVAFHPDGTRIATVTPRVAQVWDLATDDPVARFEPSNRHYFHAVAFSPDGTRLATGDGIDTPLDKAGTATIWDVAGKTEVASFDHDLAVTAIDFSPDGTSLATASGNSARIWPLASTASAASFVHDARVVDVAFSPLPGYLATVTADKTVHIWALERRMEIMRLPHEDRVNSVAFTPDGARVATAGDDGVTRLWVWRREDMVDAACGTVRLNLSHRQWKQYVGDEPYAAVCAALPVAPDPPILSPFRP